MKIANKAKSDKCVGQFLEMTAIVDCVKLSSMGLSQGILVWPTIYMFVCQLSFCYFFVQND